jgi:hypothetical protein
VDSKTLVGLVTEAERTEGYLSMRRTMEVLPGVTHPGSVARIAKRLEWDSRLNGGSREYDLEQVLAERERRLEDAEPAGVA